MTENYAPGQFPFYFNIVKTQIDAKPKACQAAKDNNSWKAITEKIARFVDLRRGIYTIFSEFSLLVVLLACYFWIIPPSIDFSKVTGLQQHLIDILYYITPEFMEGFIAYSIAKNPIVGLGIFFYIVFHFIFSNSLRQITNFFCRQARDTLIKQEPVNQDKENKSSVAKKSPIYNLLLIEGVGLIIVFISVVLIVINILAFVQKKPERCTDSSNIPVKQVSINGDSITVNADKYWNASGLFLEKGVEYIIDIDDKEQIWWDWNQKAKWDGWVEKEQGLIKSLNKVFARNKEKGLFFLMGSVHKDCTRSYTSDYQITIRPGEQFTAEHTGKFYTFANDWPFMYWNNKGSIKIRISKVK
jgi:hypothetical protein